MPNWTDLVSDSEELQAMYEPHNPSIDEVTLRALTLFRIGADSTKFLREGGTPAADITFDLTDPPRRLPESWTEEEQRTAASTVTLRLLCLSDLHSEGRMSVDATMRATLVGTDAGITLRLSSDFFEFSAKANSAAVLTFSVNQTWS